MNKQPFGISRLFPVFLPAIILLSLFSVSCSNQSTGSGKIVATVNNDPIKLNDFQREIALRSRQDPSYKVTDQSIDEQLDMIIDRRLMIQEATKMGLVNNEDFVRTIQTFWEQTLIRELIAAKDAEWEKRLFVTEEEINDYYDNMRFMVTFKIIRAEDKAGAEMLLERAKKGESLNWKTVGPVNYFDNAYGAFKTALKMPEGGKGILKDNRGFFVYLVEKKDTVKLPPLDELYSQIKTEMFERKKTGALDEWLKEVRNKASIKINKKAINSFLNANDQNSQAGGESGK